MADYQNGDIKTVYTKSGDFNYSFYQNGSFDPIGTMLGAKTLQTVSNFIPPSGTLEAVKKLPDALTLMSSGGVDPASKPEGLTGGKAFVDFTVETPIQFTAILKFIPSASFGATAYPLMGSANTGFGIAVDGQGHITVTSPQNGTLSYDMAALGVDLYDGNAHELCLIGHNGSASLIFLFIDGKIFTPYSTRWQFSFSGLVVRGTNKTSTEVVAPRDLLPIRELTIYDTALHYDNYTPSSVIDTTYAIGAYPLTYNATTSSTNVANTKTGWFRFLPRTYNDLFGALNSWTVLGYQAKYNDDGVYGGVVSLNTDPPYLEDFTLEIPFKFSPTVPLADNPTLLNNDGGLFAGIKTGANGAFSVRNIAAGGDTWYDSGVSVNDGQWHNFAITREAGLFSFFLDGTPFAQNKKSVLNFSNLYFRGWSPDNHVLADNDLTIRNITLSGYRKYYGPYNPNLTPQSPTFGAIGFYPLHNGLIRNQLREQKTVTLHLNPGDGLEYTVLRSGVTPDGASSAPWITLSGDTTASQSIAVNGADLFIRNITGNPAGGLT